MRAKDDIHTVSGKKEFIRNFLRSIKFDMDRKAEQMPSEWDGMELRWILASLVADEQHGRVARFTVPRHFQRFRRRVKEYENERLVRNL